jgi:hypothetical protein
MTTLGNIRSENVDMSNEKSCEKHDHQKFKGFCYNFENPQRSKPRSGRV